jgi:hypothetical protein
MTPVRNENIAVTSEAKGAEALRNREGLIIEKAADEFDEIAVAFERDLAGSK